MSWTTNLGLPNHSDYFLPEVKAFNDAVIRSFHSMQRGQACMRVVLGPGYFPHTNLPEHQVFMCRVADNMSPRVWCEDRELILHLIKPWLVGVDPKEHGGQWLSRALLESFMKVGPKPVDLKHHLCKKAYTDTCPGRKTMCIPKVKDLKETKGAADVELA